MIRVFISDNNDYSTDHIKNITNNYKWWNPVNKEGFYTLLDENYYNQLKEEDLI